MLEGFILTTIVFNFTHLDYVLIDITRTKKLFPNKECFISFKRLA